jgi:7-cyano-7-deazaguanine tRNA-ribosyltransferase
MNNSENSASDIYSFEMIARDGLARIGRFRTSHGDISTPTLMPVINPNNITVPIDVMERELKLQCYITNSYIIQNNEDLRSRALEKGVHDLLGTDLPIMTDSGTFQMYVYGGQGHSSADFSEKQGGKKVAEPDPVEIVRFQSGIGSDIITILDKFIDPSISHGEAEARTAETLVRAKAAVEHKGKSALACTVQGGVYPELREKAASDLGELSCEVHPIGGVVPLMENYRYAELAEIVIASKKGLPPNRPVHLFGAGHPMLFPLAVYLGCDLFDSSSYAKYAKDGRMMYPDGTRHLTDIEEHPCGCPVCSKYKPAELKELSEKERTEKLAMHNLYVSFNELKAVRQAVHEGTLRELVERRANVHPYLMDAMKVPGRHLEFLEQFEPLSRRRFLYSGPESSSRPEIYRYKQRFFARYSLPEAKLMVVFEDRTGQKPYSSQFTSELESLKDLAPINLIAVSFFGPVPFELEDIYPLAQSVIPSELEVEDRKRVNKLMEHFSHRNREAMGVIWDGEETLEFLRSMQADDPTAKSESALKGEGPAVPMDILKTLAVADMQFGKGAGDVITGLAGKSGKERADLASSTLTFRKSERTGRIRNVYLNGEHIISFRARDGYMTLKPAGAVRLKEGMPRPALRVVVNPDSAEYNRQGKSVFAKFVLDCDPNLRPGDEVLVVDEADNLVAVGRALMTKSEMQAFNSGIAVRVRDGIKE